MDASENRFYREPVPEPTLHEKVRTLVAEHGSLNTAIVAASFLESDWELLRDADAERARVWDKAVAVALDHAIRNDDGITLRLEKPNPYKQGDDPCDHPCWTGVDTTPLDDPAKVWRCDSCGQIIQPDQPGDPS